MVSIENLLNYLKEKIPNFQKTSKRGQQLFTCPRESEHKFKTNSPTMTAIPGSDKFYCLSCGFKGTIYDLIRLVEKKPTLTNEEIVSFMTNTMKCDIYPELDYYLKYGWSLFVIAKNSKKPVKDEHWREKEFNSKDKSKWIQWIESEHNLAVNCEFSNVMIIDFDDKEVEEESIPLRNELKKMLDDNKTLMQNTPRGGKHYIFIFDSELCFKQKVNVGGLCIDTRTDKGYFLVSPSKINNLNYNWVNLGSDIKNVSPELKSKLLELIKVNKGRNEKMSSEMSQKTKDAIENPIELTSNNLEGCCNDTFIRFGGVLLKMGISIDIVKGILFYLNKNWLRNPMPVNSIEAMLGSLDGYKGTEEQTQEQSIYEACQIIQTDISAKDIIDHVFPGEKNRRAIVDKYLAKFHKEGKLSRRGRGRYDCKTKVEWVNEAQEQAKEIKYKIPYFDDVAYFRNGDIILIGAPTGHGKTTIAINFIKQMKDQGIIPFYLSLEAGCFDSQTEILTNKGWKYFKNLDKTETVATLNPKTKELEYQKPINYFCYDYEGKMYQIKNRYIDLLVSPEHKQPAYKRYSKEIKLYNIKDLPKYNNIPKTGIWKGKKERYFILPGISYNHYLGKYKKYIGLKKPTIKIKMEDWLEFFGLYLSEGSLCDKYRVSISQSDKSKYLPEIKRILNNLPFKYTYTGHQFRISDYRLATYLKQFGKCNNKFVPQYIKELNSNLIEKLLYGIFIGDGTYITNHTGKVYFTTSKLFADDLQELMLKSNKFGQIGLNRKRDTYINNFGYYRNHDVYRVSEIKSINKAIASPKEIKLYKGKIYDVEVEKNNILYIRRNGKACWSGNSRHEKTAKALGLTQKDYYIPKEEIVNPLQIEIEPDSFTILDWLYTGDDFAQTQAVFKHFNDEMVRKGGTLVVFTQLKEDYNWFAVNLVKSFPRFAARFIYDDDTGIVSHFDICKITDPKGHYQNIIIPTEFNFETKELKKKNDL